MSAFTTLGRVRLIPIVMVAAMALLGLKAVSLLTHGGYLFVPEAQASSKKEEPAEAPPAPPPTEAKPNGVAPVSESERAILEALQKRRDEIEAQTRDLDTRETLLQATEKRIEERLAELKRLEQEVAAVDDRSEAAGKARVKDIVTMYEGMKVKDAARIFDRLELPVLLQVVSGINPRKMAEIMGYMSSEAAERLTVALARRGGDAPRPTPVAARDLPKIEGRPTGR